VLEKISKLHEHLPKKTTFPFCKKVIFYEIKNNEKNGSVSIDPFILPNFKPHFGKVIGFLDDPLRTDAQTNKPDFIDCYVFKPGPKLRCSMKPENLF